MRRISLVNGQVVHEEIISEGQDPSILHYEGFYDTVIDDPDGTLHVGDTYDLESYTNHYYPQNNANKNRTLAAPIL